MNVWYIDCVNKFAVKVWSSKTRSVCITGSYSLTSGLCKESEHHYAWHCVNARLTGYTSLSGRCYFNKVFMHIASVVICTVYPKKYAHGFVVLCFVVVMQSFIMNSHEIFIHVHQGCFAGTGAIVRLPQCQWNKPDGYGKISQCITTTKHSKAKTVCIFLGIYCI